MPISLCISENESDIRFKCRIHIILRIIKIVIADQQGKAHCHDSSNILFYPEKNNKVI